MTMTNETEIRRLRVPLSADEIAQRHQQLVEALTRAERIEEEIRAYKESRKSALKDAEQARATALREIRERVTDRDVECEWVADYRRGCWLLRRTDQGEVIEESAMTVEERQESLDFAGAKAAEDGGADGSA